MSAATSDARSEADSALIGRRIGGYSIRRRLGAGGMGVVYEATHEQLGKRAAVKVLHAQLSADPKSLQRFFNEAKAISTVQHPGLVQIFDYGQLDDGTAYILMEYL